MGILKIVAAALAPFVMIFLGCAFIEMTIDPRDWPQGTRELCVMVGEVFGVITAIFAATDGKI